MIELVSAILRLVYTFPTSLDLSLIAKWLASKHIYTDRFPPTAPSQKFDLSPIKLWSQFLPAFMQSLNF